MSKIKHRQFSDGVELFLKYGLAAAGVVLMVLHFVDGAAFPKWWSYLAQIFLPFAPAVLERLHVKISRRLRIAYYLFLIPAMLLGICLNWYTRVYILGQPVFDKIAHALSGVLAVFVAKEVLDRNYTGKNYAFCFLMLVSFVALTAVGWECFEFLIDKIFDENMQELITSGVDDTMWDMIGAMGTGIVAALPICRWNAKQAMQQKMS